MTVSRCLRSPAATSSFPLKTFVNYLLFYSDPRTCLFLSVYLSVDLSFASRPLLLYHCFIEQTFCPSVSYNFFLHSLNSVTRDGNLVLPVVCCCRRCRQPFLLLVSSCPQGQLIKTSQGGFLFLDWFPLNSAHFSEP